MSDCNETVMLTQWFAGLGLLLVVLIALHWALDARLRRGRLTGAWLQRLHAVLDGWGRGLDPEHRADRRRHARVIKAQHQREAIARASAPMPLDEPVQWDGNVARPAFGRGRRAARPPHNLH